MFLVGINFSLVLLFTPKSHDLDFPFKHGVKFQIIVTLLGERVAEISASFSRTDTNPHDEGGGK
jgi:hypothetical protein